MPETHIPQPMTSQELAEFGRALLTREALFELALLAVALLLAWAVVRAVRRQVRVSGRSVLFGDAPPTQPGALATSTEAAAPGPAKRKGQGALLPLLAVAFALLVRYTVLADAAAPVFRIAIPLLLSWAVMQLVVRVLGMAFPASPSVRAVERWVSWTVLVALLLWLTGLLPVLAARLEAVSWTVGATRMSLLTVLEGAFNVVVVLMLALWLSAAIETRLLKGQGHNLSVRKMAANATRALLLFIGLMVALSAAGIDLTAFSVLGGALGVGLGFGLQKLASNYVSGFVILAERSLRIGDLVKVDNFEGRITDINTRATIIRADSGRESIVPNEMLIIQRVENASSLVDASQSGSSVLCLPFGTDVPALRPKLLAALGKVPRVMQDAGHAPAVYLSHFLPDGLEVTVTYSVADPGNGMSSVGSDVNLAVLGVLDASGIALVARPRGQPDASKN